MPQESERDLDAQALILSRAQLQGLNCEHAVTLFRQAMRLHLGPNQRALPLPMDAVSGVGRGLRDLACAILQQCGQVPLSLHCVVLDGDVASMLAYLQTQSCQDCHLVRLDACQFMPRLWMPLVKGSLVQGEPGYRPGCDPVHACVGQICLVQTWQVLLIEDASKCHVVPPVSDALGLWLLACHVPALPPPAVAACRLPLSPSAAVAQVERKSHDLRGESLFSSSAEGDKKANNRRWYHNLPMPSVKPVDKDLLYHVEEDENGMGLDGLRLATMSAIRDQETAIARELQMGDEELAKMTAENLAEMNRTLDGLEEALCVVTDPLATWYENEGPQNRDIS